MPQLGWGQSLGTAQLVLLGRDMKGLCNYRLLAWFQSECTFDKLSPSRTATASCSHFNTPNSFRPAQSRPAHSIAALLPSFADLRNAYSPLETGQVSHPEKGAGPAASVVLSIPGTHAHNYPLMNQLSLLLLLKRWGCV